ncbi:hypothetical protein EMIT0P294_180051 [Pseudomonas sp. IT-P294]
MRLHYQAPLSKTQCLDTPVSAELMTNAAVIPYGLRLWVEPKILLEPFTYASAWRE